MNSCVVEVSVEESLESVMRRIHLMNNGKEYASILFLNQYGQFIDYINYREMHNVDIEEIEALAKTCNAKSTILIKQYNLTPAFDTSQNDKRVEKMLDLISMKQAPLYESYTWLESEARFVEIYRRD